MAWRWFLCDDPDHPTLRVELGSILTTPRVGSTIFTIETWEFHGQRNPSELPKLSHWNRKTCMTCVLIVLARCMLRYINVHLNESHSTWFKSNNAGTILMLDMSQIRCYVSSADVESTTMYQVQCTCTIVVDFEDHFLHIVVSRTGLGGTREPSRRSKIGVPCRTFWNGASNFSHLRWWWWLCLCLYYAVLVCSPDCHHVAWFRSSKNVSDDDDNDTWRQ